MGIVGITHLPRFIQAKAFASCLTIHSNLFDFSEIRYKNCSGGKLPSQNGIRPLPQLIEKRAYERFNYMKEVKL
jgi:hypothetical protein